MGEGTPNRVKLSGNKNSKTALVLYSVGERNIVVQPKGGGGKWGGGGGVTLIRGVFSNYVED